jgi:hypothetical protein
VTDEENFLDLGDPGPSLGDEFIFHDVLWKHGDKVGHDGGVCTATSANEGEQGEFECEVTFWFEGGQIASQGLIQPPTDLPARFRLPVTGGSGRYEGAEGELHVLQRTETKAELTIHLS